MNEINSEQQQSVDEEMTIIRNYVDAYRQQYNVNPLYPYDVITPLSEEASGEGYVLLYQELVPTRTGYGAWKTLEQDRVRHLVLEQILKDERSASTININK
ncbi:hypothetical protein HY496_03600 [Candidatus Woesearchaeota archaeon]|nr:hypothetical protein [Candidatus Woesearchaeota archaeon]